MKHHFLLTILSALLAVMPSTIVKAQRIQQPLGRGVVAVYGTSNGSAGVEITWRRLAQEPEDARYNILVSKTEEGGYSLLNDTPLTNTNYATTLAKVPYGSFVKVELVTNAGEEAASKVPCKPFLFTDKGQRNIFVEISYDASPLDKAKYSTKFVWPCDLNGDGEYDYVVDRCPVDGSRNFFVEGYLSDGTFLWNIDLGVNEKPCDGQNDNMCSYDIDCDGFGELIVQTSDGTRFWDKTAGTWGKYVLGNTTGDTDGDGIIDYDTQSTKNPPRYMSVVDGMTGAEKASAEFLYDDAYNRTNKSSLMGDEYNKHEAHVGIFYHDGIHPAICGEWLSRRASDKVHMYRNCAFAYDFDANGKATNWHQLFMENIGGAEFHMIRIFDADGDGKDEMSSGAYVMDHNGKTLYNTGISHGDRHRTSDIDPEHPGLETFSIQQNAPDMLGQILFDAATGEPLKKWYLPAVGDVGRGECMDLDPDHLGWEMFSTMDGYQMFDAKGNKIEGKYGYFPTEGVWWDGQLDRENVAAPDGSGYNAMIVDYKNGRLIEMAKESGWTMKASYGARAKYWGDIIGDWREEVIIIRERDGVCQGIVGFSTDYKTNIDNIYCLQQDPHYRADCTTRGYYQSPNPGFYLGYDMPRPQLPPCMVADETTDVFGIAEGNAVIMPRTGVKKVYAMPVKNQTLTLQLPVNSDSNDGLSIIKSQQGTLEILNTTTLKGGGSVIISEGTVHSLSVLSFVDLRARGTLSGSLTVDSLVAEGALHYEGCRLMPEGEMCINHLTLPEGKKIYIELTPGKDYLTLTPLKEELEGGTANSPLRGDGGVFIFTINEDLASGEYLLINGGDIQPEQCDVRGLTGKSFSIEPSTSTPSGVGLKLVIHEQREPSTDVVWTGAENGTWDYQTPNFTISGTPTGFVANDQVIIGDEALSTTITLPVLYPTSGVIVNGSKNFTIQGDGGFSGEGGLTVDMNEGGSLALNAVHSDYTGATRLLGGAVSVKEIADMGFASSIGAGKTIEMNRTKLTIYNTNAATNRTIALADTSTVNIPSGTTSLKGKISGKGVLVKDGAGQLNITYAGANAWNGTILKNGTLAMGAWNTTFGNATSPIDVTGNATIVMFDCNNTSTVPNLQNTITVAKGKTLTLNTGYRCKVSGSWKGEGTIKISFPYVRADIYTNMSDFAGTLQATSGQMRLINATDLSKATLQLDAGVSLAHYSAGSGNTQTTLTTKIGALKTSATDATIGAGIWEVGAAGTNTTFAGQFDSSATLRKVGDGKLTITGTLNCGTTINGGELANKGKMTAATTINDGATLTGNGTFPTITVNKGGTFAPGISSIGTTAASLTGQLNVKEGGILRLTVNKTATALKAECVETTGKITLTSPIIAIELYNNGNTLEDGDSLTIFKGSSITLNGTPTFEPATPGQSLKWDYSTLATDGILRIIADPNAIQTITTQPHNRRTIYDLQGRKVNNPTKGIYIIDGQKVHLK